MVVKNDTDSNFEQYHSHCSQNSILIVKDCSSMTNFKLSVVIFQYVPIV